MKARLNGFSAKDGMQHANDNKKLGKMRRLDASDERSIDHPSQTSAASIIRVTRLNGSR